MLSARVSQQRHTHTEDVERSLQYSRPATAQGLQLPTDLSVVF